MLLFKCFLHTSQNCLPNILQIRVVFHIIAFDKSNKRAKVPRCLLKHSNGFTFPLNYHIKMLLFYWIALVSDVKLSWPIKLSCCNWDKRGICFASVLIGLSISCTIYILKLNVCKMVRHICTKSSGSIWELFRVLCL